MKRVALLTMTLVFATTMAYAYCGFCPLSTAKKSEEWAQKKIEAMTERLSLTEEQVGQIEPLVKEKIEKKRTVMEAAHAKKGAIKEEYSAKIRALLNEEQQIEYDAWKKEREEEMKQMKGSGYGYKHKMMEKEDKGSKKGS